MYLRTNSTLIVCVAGFLMTACAFLSRRNSLFPGQARLCLLSYPTRQRPKSKWLLLLIHG